MKSDMQKTAHVPYIPGDNEVEPVTMHRSPGI